MSNNIVYGRTCATTSTNATRPVRSVVMHSSADRTRSIAAVACKTMHNNGLARERRLAEKRIAGGLLRNHQILETLLDEAGQDSITVDTSVLGALGFDRNAPNGRAVVQGRPCYLYGGIAYSVNEASNKASIFKIK
jgi:hypothetical protein